MRIRDHVAIVTGAASGLGAAAAARLAGLGARLVAVDIDGAALRRAAGALGAHPVEADVTDTEAVAAMVGTAGELGELRIVVHCAGGSDRPCRTVSRSGRPHPLDPWRRTVELNLIAAFDVTRQAAAAMARLPETGGGRGVIVHTSSIAGLDASGGLSAYSAAKAGLVAMARSSARDLSVWGVRVLAVAPGAFDTPLYAGLGVGGPHDRDGVYPGRLGRPDEYAALVEHLIVNDYLNAACVRIDAGLYGA